VNYTEFFFTNQKKIVVSKTLKEFEDLLTDLNFYRVHQSHLVNTKCIREYVKTEGGHLIMTDGSLVPVSTRRKTEVLKMLDRL
jgi:two-component system LytT family response regulator